MIELGVWSNQRKQRCCRPRCFRAFIVALLLLPCGAALAARPAIWGVPSDRAMVGKTYTFQPGASDADGDRLIFWLQGRPSWATLDWRTGELTGTPTAADVGVYPSIVFGVSDAPDRDRVTWLAPFDLTVTSSDENQRPTISGNPPTTATVGQLYSFTPTASDPDGDELWFWTRNRPPWASINRSTGRLYGTPQAADVGTYDDIVLNATDGLRNVPLAAFSIAVLPTAAGSATLSWIPPTQRTDGSPLNNLAGYRVLWGTREGSYSNSVRINNPGITTYVVDNLAPATYHFVVVAFDSNGEESGFSNSAQKTVSP